MDYLSSYKQFCVKYYNEDKCLTLFNLYDNFMFETISWIYFNYVMKKLNFFFFFLEKRKNRYYRIFLYKWSIVDLKNMKVIYLTSKIFNHLFIIKWLI